MIIYFYDGGSMKCKTIEIGMDGIIVDGRLFFPFREVQRIVHVNSLRRV